MKKRTMYTEAAYILGLAVLAMGTALMEAADFGMSMVVAPAYLVHLKLFAMGWSFFSFGMAEYMLQFVLLVLLTAVMRRFRIAYLFSFVTAVIYGMLLDGAMTLMAMVPFGGMAARTVYYVLGMAVCSLGVALLFNTYLPPEAYELVVKEFSDKFGKKISITKTVYDCVSCTAAIAMSFAFFGFGVFEGVKWGTIVCALVNGWMIGRISDWFGRKWTFVDGMKLRGFFA